ncbi:hypothetical protein [Amycolatopsis sp. NPDC003731]
MTRFLVDTAGVVEDVSRAVDMLGVAVEPGDRVAYSVRSGNTAETRVGRVAEVAKDGRIGIVVDFESMFGKVHSVYSPRVCWPAANRVVKVAAGA